MDDSMISRNYTTLPPLTSTPDNYSSEESGWTLYFEDFMANRDVQQHNNNTDSLSSSECQNSSMISDAAFRKVGNRKLASKNRKITSKKFVVDDELEDTASSPCHSPKVNDLNQLYMKSKELNTQDVGQQVNYSNYLQIEHAKDKYIGFSQEKGRTPQHAGEGNNNMGIVDTQLRRKGLCLVPMSMLINNHLS